jgi:manganese efflux pump family protein
VIGLFELYLVAVAISLDTFAAAIALGTRTPPRGWLRVALVFAVSGGLFPLVGMGLGLLASGMLAQVAGAFGVLVIAGLGVWFLHGAIRPGTRLESNAGELPLGGLVLLSIGLSSDNLLVGLGLGLHGGTTVLLGALTTASVFGATITGLWLGRRKRTWLGPGAEALAGVLLLALAVFLLTGWLQNAR